MSNQDSTRADLPERWRAHFEVIDGWLPATFYVALSARVLAVAKTRIEGAWSAYIDAVPGKQHGLEQHEVLEDGAKLPERIARVIFPGLDGVPYAR